MQASMPLVCPLNDAVCIGVTGADAGEFLRAQLARDPPPLGADHTVPAAWLDARGRVRALFRVVALGQDYLLLGERETADAVLAKLRMFVLRSRVSLAVKEDWQAAAVIGTTEERRQAHGIPALEAADSVASRGEVRWLRVGPELVYLVGPRALVVEATAGFEPVNPDAAALAEIRLGWPKVGAALMDRYVPQMLNLDLLGAVAFDKGCYPGQEVAARLKYRGSVKRRLRRFACTPATLPVPGDEIVDATGAPAGEVVRAARAGNRVELLAVVPLDAIAGALSLAADRGVTLE
jgi:folate-binding protein YgfZ